MKLLPFALALGACGLLATSAARLSTDCPVPFDFNSDGTPDTFQVGPDASTAQVVSGSPGSTVLYLVNTGNTESTFSGAAVAMSRPGAAAPDLVAGLAVNSENPLGGLACLDPTTGTVRWTVSGVSGNSIGGSIRSVPDQDDDGICELLSAESADGTTSAMLVSGTGALLAIRNGTLSGLAHYAEAGGRLFARQDLDDSGQVDSADIDTFLGYAITGDLRGDMTGDGLVDGDDFVIMVNAHQAGLNTVVATAIPPGIQSPQQSSSSAPPAPPSDCSCDQNPGNGCKMSVSCGAVGAVPPGQGAVISVQLTDGLGNLLQWNTQPSGEWCASILDGPEGAIVSVDMFGNVLVNSDSEGDVTFRVRFTYTGENGEQCSACAECGVAFEYPCISRTCVAIAGCELVRAINSSGELTAMRCGLSDLLDLEKGRYTWTVESELGGVSPSVPRIWWNGARAFFEITGTPTDTAPENRVRVRVTYIDECGPVVAECLFHVSGDTDGDGLADVTEDGLRPSNVIYQCLDKDNPDSDYDGFTDSQDPFPCDDQLGPDIVLDSDGDAIPDFYERQEVVWDPFRTQHPQDPSGIGFPPPAGATQGTNSRDFDTDDDGIADSAEITLGLDPLEPKSNAAEPGVRDGDTAVYIARDPSGIFDEYAERRGFSPVLADQDGDGLSDNWELRMGLDPEFPDQGPAAAGDQTDTDGDGLSDAVELAVGLSPSNPDSDEDGVLDGDEAAMDSDALDSDSDDDGVSDGDSDFDHDGLSNIAELWSGTDPRNPDSDGDGVCDSQSDLSRFKGIPGCVPGLPNTCADDCQLLMTACKPSGSTETFRFDGRTFGGTCSTDTLQPLSQLPGILVPYRQGWHEVEYTASHVTRGVWWPFGAAFKCGNSYNIVFTGWPGCLEHPSPEQWPYVGVLHNMWFNEGIRYQVERTAGNHYRYRWQLNFDPDRADITPAIFIDSDNDNGYELPEGTKAEYDLGSAVNHPGKIIWISESDSDGDSIPDYADGYGLLGTGVYSSLLQEGEIRTDRDNSRENLVPMVVYFPGDMGPNDEIEISYPLSDPFAVTRTSSDPFQLPSSGTLRIWRTPPNQEATRSPGGQVRVSSVIGTRRTQLTEPCSGAGNRCPLSRELVQVGTFSPAQLGVRPGQVVKWYVEAVRPSTTIGGEVISIAVRPQGQSVTDIAQVKVTAIGRRFIPIHPDGTPGSATKAGPVSDPVPVITVDSTSVSNIRVDPSDPTRILADVTVSGTVDDAACDLVSGPAGAISTLGAFINEISQSDTAVTYTKATLPTPTDPLRLLRPFDYAGNFSKTYSGVEVDVGYNAIELTATGPYGAIGHTKAVFTIDRAPPATPNGEDWTGYTFTSQPPNIPPASTGGVMTPMLMELVGPPGLDTYLDGAQIGSSTYKLRLPSEADVAAFPSLAGRLLFCAESGQNPISFSLVHEQRFTSLTELQPHRPGFSFIDQAQEPEGLGEYAKGVARGFADAGIAWKDNFVDLGKGIVGACEIGGSITVRAFRSLGGGDLFTTEELPGVIANLAKGGAVAQVVADFLEQEGPAILEFAISIATNQEERLNAMSAAGAVVADLLCEVWEEVQDALVLMSDYEKGRIVGRITGELAIFVAENSTGVALGKAALLKKIGEELGSAAGATAKVAKLVGGKADEATRVLTARLVQKFTRLVEIAEEFRTTRMCFVSGTPVLTPSGLVPIECLEVGDYVLAGDDAGNLDYRAVTRCITTQPDTLCSITYCLNDGRHDTITCTPEHPFYVPLQKCFVNATDLSPGDELGLANGTRAVILRRFTFAPSRRTFTYNIEVDDFHTYFVGIDGLWVHNSGDAECVRVLTVWRMIFNKVCPTNPMEGYWRTRSKLPGMSRKVEETVVPEVLAKIKQLALNRQLEGRWQDMGVDPAVGGTLARFREREVFAAFNYEKKFAGRTLQRWPDSRLDFMETAADGSIIRKWDVKGPFDYRSQPNQVIGSLRDKLEEAAGDPDIGDMQLLIDLSGSTPTLRDEIRKFLVDYPGRYLIMED